MHLSAIVDGSDPRTPEASSKPYRYWRADPTQRSLTYDLEAYNRDVLRWLMAGRSGTPPHPGELIVSDAPTCPNWPKALSLHRTLLASPVPLPAAVVGPFDDEAGRCQIDRYRFALATWQQGGEQGAPPHPGHRIRPRRRDPQWHAAIETFNMLRAVINAPLSPTSRAQAALTAGESLLAAASLSEAADRTLREAWVAWRWGAQDIDARDLYGAGAELTAKERDYLAHAERLYLAHLDRRTPGWPDTPAAALRHIASSRRSGALEAIDPEYPVGQLRLLIDGIRRLAQEAKRMRNRGRAEDSDRVAAQVRRQLRDDQDRAEHQKSRFVLKRDTQRYDPHAIDTRWLRTDAEIREIVKEREQARKAAAADQPRRDDADVALLWQLANLPPEILTDADGLPVFDDWGRLVLKPEHLPEDDSPRETARVKVLRSRHRPVYLRLGFPLPPELDGALYQTLKATGQLPPPTDQPLTYEWTKFDLANDQARLHDELYEPQEREDDLYGETPEPRAPQRSIYDQGHEYRAILRQRLADINDRS